MITTLEAELDLIRNKNKSQGIPKWFESEYDKYPFAKVFWQGRPVIAHEVIVPKYDVRNFVTIREFSFEDEDIPIEYTGKTDREKYDSIVLSVAKYIAPKIKYVTDDKNYGFEEYWSTPQETWALKEDDCEGSTNLFISMMINKGVPWYLLRKCCGMTYSGFGHSTLYYYASDNRWHHIECTKNRFTEQKATDFPLRNATDSSNIKSVWFSFDAFNAFNKFTTNGRKSYKQQEHSFIIE